MRKLWTILLVLVTALVIGACGNAAQTSVKEADVATDIQTEVQAKLDTLNEGWSVTVDCTRMSDSKIECVGVAESGLGTMEQRYVANIAEDGEVIWHSEGEASVSPNPDYEGGYEEGYGY